MKDLILIILAIISGVWSRDWRVTLQNQCALRGSSVVIACEYDYPFAAIVTRVDWAKVNELRLVLLSQLPSPADHFQYVGDYQGNCDLQINDVQQTDKGQYYFSFSTTFGSLTSRSFSYLSVEDLTINVEPSTVAEGGNVTLTCYSGCPTLVYVVWFRDGQPAQNPVFQAKREDAGKYRCAVRGEEHVRSAAVALNVQYAPNKVTLSMSPPGNVVRGGSVTFTCRSDANPPVAQSGYALYKDGQLLQSGQNYTVRDIQPSHSGRYHCHAWNNVSWGGSDFFNSPDVHLDVKYPPVNTSISVAGSGSVNLTCSSTANPPAYSYTWYMRSDSTSSMLYVGSGQVMSIPSVEASNTARYLCQAGNRLGAENSTEMPLRKQQGSGNQSVPIIAGIGVFLFVALLLVLLFWRKQLTYAGKKVSIYNTVSDFRFHEEDSSTSNDSNSLYANVHTLPLYRPPVSPHQRDAKASHENQMVYAKVTFNPRHPSRIKDEANEDSVIYATVAKSS
ncbi:igLON family member 5-like [Brachionichthys hirsutus]|uniref:igLON family member 5-like n=1 Tax=Brachionichthys hirsutus TaxID=412623 RepID=UPI0036049613